MEKDQYKEEWYAPVDVWLAESEVMTAMVFAIKVGGFTFTVSFSHSQCFRI